MILHGHIFKNAGSTFDWSLQRCFGESFLDHRDDDAMRQGGAAYVARFICDHPELRALSSHHLPLPAPEIDHVALFTVVFIRHPIDRIRSVYEFERRQPGETLGAKMAGQMSFLEYVRWRMKKEAPATVKNFQVRYCARTPSGGAPGEESRLSRSMEFLERRSLVGVVDRYDESMVVFEDILREKFPDIDLSYRKQNVGNRDQLSLEERIEETEAELGPELAELAYEQNRDDIALYQYANDLLDARLAQISDLSHRLREFRERMAHRDNSPGRNSSVLRGVRDKLVKLARS